MRQAHKTLLLWVVLIVAFLAIWQFLSSEDASTIPYSAFVTMVRDPKQVGEIEEVVVAGRKYSIKFKPKAGTKTKEKMTVGPADLDAKLLLDHGFKVVFETESDNVLTPLLTILLPILFVIVMFYLFMRQLQMGGGKALSFGKSRARLLSESAKRIEFAHVLGADEAKEALGETVAFLRNPKAFLKTGSRVRKGVLLTGPPGTGKTLLAQAIAGEAGVPFFSISGSDFVEMFVGVGASRVRDLFEQGKKHSPCIVFIDELDAVGRQRGSGLGGGHDEREQTLNQLLSELDGFEDHPGIIVLGATNRVDVLDDALLRPGRFDRIIPVLLPGLDTRRALFKHYIAEKPIAAELSDDYLIVLAERSAGLSGADIESLVNEAAILAARRGREFLRRADFEDALHRVGHRLPLTGEPERLVQAVSGQVAGQTQALRALAHALCSHYGDSVVATDLELTRNSWKPNVMLYGPSGSGKSWLLEACARELDVPVAFIDVTALAADSERFITALRRLLQAAGNSERRARLGIVCVSGLEKVLARELAGIQIELARIIEGAKFEVSTADVYADRTTKLVKTAHLLFIAELALVPSAPSSSEQLKSGAIAPAPPDSRAARYRLLRRHGVLPQLLDAFPVIQPVRGLGHEDLQKILGEPPGRVPEADPDEVEAIMSALTSELHRRFDQNVRVTTTKDGAESLMKYLPSVGRSKRFQRSLLDASASQLVAGRSGLAVALTGPMIQRATQGILTPTILERYYQRFKASGIELRFESAAIGALASHAAGMDGNARALVATLDEIVARNRDKFQAVAPNVQGVRIIQVTQRMITDALSGDYTEPLDRGQVA